MTIGAVGGAPTNPAPTIEKPIKKNNEVNINFDIIPIPSLLSSFDLDFDTIHLLYMCFLALSRAHPEYIFFKIKFSI